MADFNFGSNLLTNPKIVGGGQAFINSMQNMGKFGSGSSNVLDSAEKIGNMANKASDVANKYVHQHKPLWVQ